MPVKIMDSLLTKEEEIPVKLIRELTIVIVIIKKVFEKCTHNITYYYIF